MNEIFLGFIFDGKKSETLIKENKFGLQIAANQYQYGFIKGFEKRLQIISVLPAGTYPKNSKKARYYESVGEVSGGKVQYIPFINVYFVKEYSQKRQLLKELKKQILPDEKYVIYVYSLYMPFLKVLKKIKRKFSNIYICLIIPDLPGKYGIMRKITSLGGIRDRLEAQKKIAMAGIADSYIFLTEKMKEVFPKRPYAVIEGFLPNSNFPQNVKRQPKTILYTGSLNTALGVDRLLEAFEKIEDNEYELWICGAGGIQPEVEAYTKKDRRIKYMGFLAKSDISLLQVKCDVLVNPRSNNDEFTKYSFPSKTMEYLLSGSKVVMYPLSGIPQEYFEFITVVEGDSVEDLKNTLIAACEDMEFYNKRSQQQIQWISREKTNVKHVEKLKNIFK